MMSPLHSPSRPSRPARVVARFAVLAVLVLSALPGGRARADAAAALEAAPAGSHMVLVIRSLSGGSEKLAALNEALGLDAQELGDMLARFKAEAGAINGLDDDGAMLVVVPNISALTAPEQTRPVLVLAPVSDYAAFVGNYGGKAGDDATASLTMPGGQSAFARSSGGYAVLSPNQAAVEAYAPAGGEAAAALATKLGPAGQRALISSDAALFLDIESMAPVLNPLLEVGIAQAEAEADEMAQMGVDEQTIRSMKDAFEMYAALARALLRDASSALVALDLSDAGNGLSMTLQFKDDSPLARMFPGGGEGPTGMLSDLPDQPYIFAGAIDARAMDVPAMVEAMLEHMPEHDDDEMVALTRQSLPMVRQLKGWAGALYAPAPGGAMGMFNMLQVVYAEDAEQYRAQNRQYLEGMDGLTTPAGAEGDITFSAMYQDKAMEIEGIAVDQYNVTMQLPPAMQQQMMPMMMFLGGSGIGGYIATKGDAVVSTTVTDPNLITAGLKAVGRGAGIGTDPTLAEQRRAALPENLAAEGYLSLAGIIRTANPMLQMFGVPEVQTPADLPPIAFGLGIEDSGLAYRLYVPNATVKFLIDEARNLQNQQPQQQRGAQPAPF